MPFEPARLLNASAPQERCFDGHPAVATDDTGRWMAVWTTTRPIGGTGTDHPRLVCSTSQDDGITWSTPTLVSDLCHQLNHLPVPSIAAHAGRWIITWHTAHFVSSQRREPTAGVYWSASDDFGATWSDATPLTTDFAAGDAWDSAPAVCADASGRWLIAWHRLTVGYAGQASAPQVLVSRSEDNGHTWMPPQTLGTAIPRGARDFPAPTVATDGERFLLSWIAQDPGSPAFRPINLISTTLDAGAHWADPAPLSDSPTSTYTTLGIAAGPSGHWLAAFVGRDGNYDRVFTCRSLDHGQTWSSPTAASAAARALLVGPTPFPVGPGGGEGWGLTWGASFAQHGYLLNSVSPDGLAWSPESHLHSTYTPPYSIAERDYRAATSTTGITIGAWSSDWTPAGTGSRDPDIWMIRRDSASPSTWDGARPLDPTADGDLFIYDARPDAQTDGLGQWLAVWSSTAPADSPYAGQAVVRFARSTDDGETWSTPGIAAATPQAPGGAWIMWPMLATDGHGVWAVAYAVYTSHALEVRLIRTIDNGATWSEPIVIDPAAPPNWNQTSQFDASLTTDGRGVWVLTYSSLNRPNGPAKVHVTRSLDNGVTWSSPALIDPSAPQRPSELELHPKLATNGRGLWVAAWSTWLRNDTPGPTRRLRMSVSRDNGLTWSAPTLASGDEAYWQQNGQGLVTDRQGHWLFAWDASGDEGNQVVRSIRSDDDGLTWSPVTQLFETQHPYTGGARADQFGLATDGSGTWVCSVQSQQAVSAAPILIRSIDQGLTWTPRAFVPIPPSRGETSLDVSISSHQVRASPGHFLIFGGIGGIDAIDDSDIFFTRLPTPDCDGDGIPDAAEILAGTLPDCNNNSFADPCDIALGVDGDCNANGVPDACDAAAGLLHDCNFDGVPDECQIAAGTLSDCDSDGIPDICTFGARAASDCDGNGVPDVCDIAAGRLHDRNHDWIADRCQCITDVNGDGASTLQDLFLFFNFYFNTPWDSRHADFNHDDLVNTHDLLDFVAAYIEGCGP